MDGHALWWNPPRQLASILPGTARQRKTVGLRPEPRESFFFSSLGDTLDQSENSYAVAQKFATDRRPIKLTRQYIGRNHCQRGALAGQKRRAKSSSLPKSQSGRAFCEMLFPRFPHLFARPIARPLDGDE